MKLGQLQSHKQTTWGFLTMPGPSGPGWELDRRRHETVVCLINLRTWGVGQSQGRISERTEKTGLEVRQCGEKRKRRPGRQRRGQKVREEKQNGTVSQVRSGAEMQTHGPAE